MGALLNKKNITLIVVAVVAVIALAVLFSSLYVVAENEYACVVRFSKIINTSANAGLHFKVPFVDDIKKFPKTIMFYDIPPSEALTADQKT